VTEKDSNRDPHAEQEWRDSIRAVANQQGPEEAKRLIQATINEAQHNNVDIDITATSYQNTISVDEQSPYPGDIALEQQPKWCFDMMTQ